MKKVLEKRTDEGSHRYFVRFGKGNYNRRFILTLSRGKKIKLKGSFEWASDFARFAQENGVQLFSGKVLSKAVIPGKPGKKKAGVVVYEITNESLKDYPGAYSYLLDADSLGIILKSKKALPKPGKDEEKIDDGFCSLEIEEKYWPKLKEAFVWDVPDCKKAVIEHDLQITEIELPKGEKDPVKIRENAVRKGKLVKRMNIDGVDSSKTYDLIA